MKKYKYLVSICDGWCNGFITVEAPDEEISYEVAIEDVGKRLAEAFPELDIPYNVELCEEE